MKEVLDINFYKEGCIITIANAKRLFKIAEKSADENEFSIACSLNILAAEESVKAIFLIIKHNNKTSEINDFDKMFNNHKTKHKQLINISLLNNEFITELYNEVKLADHLFKIGDNLPEPERTKYKNRFQDLYDVLQWFKKQDANKPNIEEIKKWLLNANLEKNRGFYVDKIESNWHDPSEFTKKQYQKERLYSLSLIENAEKVVELMTSIE